MISSLFVWCSVSSVGVIPSPILTCGYYVNENDCLLIRDCLLSRQRGGLLCVVLFRVMGESAVSHFCLSLVLHHTVGDHGTATDRAAIKINVIYVI